MSLYITDEGDGADVWVVADEVDGLVLAVDDIDDARGHAGLLEQLDESHARGGVALRGLHHVGVAANRGHGKHPERDHGGKVEGRDAGADAERGAEAREVHVLGDAREGLAHEEVGVGAALLDDLQAAGHVALCVGEGLPLLDRDKLCDLALKSIHTPLTNKSFVLNSVCVLTKFSLMRAWYLNIISCLLSGEVLDQELKAVLADSTARSISAWVFCGTRVTTSLVAGLGTSIQRSGLESTNLPSMTI